MLDGDRIAALCAAWLDEQIKAAGLELKIGIVQTAYANGASTELVSLVLIIYGVSSRVDLNSTCYVQVPVLPWNSCRMRKDRSETSSSYGFGL